MNLTRKISGNRLGFTIVELLIVIVVIAILAAITIVSYNGITRQAREASYLTSFDTYEKAVRLYRTAHGSFPAVGTSWVCLGEGYVAEKGFPENVCNPGIGGDAVVDENTNNALKEFVSPLPDVHDMTLILDGSAFARGIVYKDSSTQNSASIGYYLNGDAVCGRGVKTYIPSSGNYSDFTMCQLTIK